MQRLGIALLVCFTLFASGCATKKYVRTEVKTSADVLSGRIESNEGQIKEVRDNVDRVSQNVDRVGQNVDRVTTRVTGVEGQVSELNTGITALKGDVRTVDQKTAQAQSVADRAAGEIVVLDQRFQNRNLFVVAEQKAVQFKFDSASLDAAYQERLDETASMLMQNPDAIVILEGRTDSTGNRDYNVKLADRRVEAVRRYLAIEKAVPVYKIHELSLGAAKPVAENNTRDGREKNRAVTLTVLTPKSGGSVASKND